MGSPRSPRPALLALARWWAEGPVKTRLAADIGADAARHAYRQLAETVWAGLSDPSLERHLWIEPAARTECAARWLRGADRVSPQPEGGLGDRLATAFEAAFIGGAPWAAAVGMDAPDVDAARVHRAGSALSSVEVVLVPALDGGYALVALRCPAPRLFVDIPWGTSEVLAVTCARAKQLGLRVAMLEPVRDVDTLDDLTRVVARFPHVKSASMQTP